MAECSFDIVTVVDPRFQGGTSSAVSAEITAAVREGYSVALVCYEAVNLRQPMPFNPRLEKLVNRNEVTILSPGDRATCRLAILHNPYTAGLVPLDPVGITAERRLVVAHHPPVDADGVPAFDLSATRRNAEEILSGPADWVPVGPNARAAFRGLSGAPDLMPEDWHNTIDFDAWYNKPEQRASGPLRLGRHSRADLRKFPADRAAFLEIYGDDPDVLVDLLGCPAQLTNMLSPVPSSWQLRPFGSMNVRDYLDALDVFVYYHRSDWVEAFGYTVIEAMARGVPCVLPETLGPSFSSAARITAPTDALAAARTLAEAPEQARQAGYDLVRSHHSFDAATRRLSKLIGPPAKTQYAGAIVRKSEPAVLLLSTNGVGMGHLTRTLAIARRIQEPLKPVIVTMSHAASVAQDFGFHVEFIPFHNYLGVEQRDWNAYLREELAALIDAFDARVLLFDGNSPFQGLIDACAMRPSVWSIWCRRGMWQRNAGAQFMARESHFDAVIAPRDLADAFDRGPTTKSRNIMREVDPIRLLDASEQLPRDLARTELGLDPDRPAFLIQLGGGNNYDMTVVRELTVRHLARRDDIQVAHVEWMISSGAPQSQMPAHFHRLSTYPVARYLKAFDATISAVGYNSFHENFAAALPAIYVPNENPAQDDQLARASFAARNGAALVARRDQPEKLIAAIENILDPDRRQAMSEAACRFEHLNGALEAARIVSQLGMTRRGDRSDPAA
ncbi:glycosyltransferase [Tropicimonas sp. S265A]|uniref:glycosyltransferase n=1 Tax=Tropicimonas sp. S265A TaxID=3415134 RepID=UPI003C7C0A0B